MPWTYRLTFIKAPRQPGVDPRKDASVYCRQRPPLMMSNIPPLTGHFDKIDQKHHHQNEEADHHSMLEYGDNLHCIRLRMVILIKMPAGYLNKMMHN